MLSFNDHDVDPRTWPCLSYTRNRSLSTIHDPVVTLDIFALVHPFLPIYKNTILDDVWLFEEDKVEEELLPSPNLPFAAAILDRVAAELYLGLKRFMNCNSDAVLALFQNVQVSCCIRSDMIDFSAPE